LPQSLASLGWHYIARFLFIMCEKGKRLGAAWRAEGWQQAGRLQLMCGWLQREGPTQQD